MASDPTPPFPAAPKVPGDLLKELDDANSAFHSQREEMEAVHQTFNAGIDDREESLARLREADRRLEEIKHRIDATLPPAPPPSETAPDNSATRDKQT